MPREPRCLRLKRGKTMTGPHGMSMAPHGAEDEMCKVIARVPRPLKEVVCARLASRGQKFKDWVQEAMATYCTWGPLDDPLIHPKDGNHHANPV